MDKNVGSVDLDELLKARQELNSERGIETDPNMYSDYNPNRKQEEAEMAASENSAETESADFSAEQNYEKNDAENLSNAEASSNESEEITASAEEDSFDKITSSTDSSSAVADDGKVDFSVYDNFAAFDVGGNGSSYNNTDNEEDAEENQAPLSVNDEIDQMLANLSSNMESDEQMAEQTSVQTDTNESSPEVSVSVDESLKDLENLLGPTTETEQAESSIAAETADETKTEGQTEDIWASLASTPVENNTVEDAPAEEDSSSVADLENLLMAETPVQTENVQTEALKEETPATNVENNESKFEKATLSESDKFIQNINDSTSDSEQKIKDALANINKNKSAENVEAQRPERVVLPEIADVDFIDVIGSSDYENLDKYSYILGKNELGKFEFASLKDNYNNAIFSKNEDNTFKFFNSVILSLMLKNSKDDVCFALCDTKRNSIFDSYQNSSYLYDSVAKSQDDIINILSKIILDIDERYETIASSGTKNIEEYNRAMSLSYIAELPYIVLCFNNYVNVSHLENFNKIRECLAYILKYGRLVGVYTYIATVAEIEDDSINYNLATRISFSADYEEESVKQLGEVGAENLSGTDEYLLKTLYAESVSHIKIPNIAKREVELLVENIER